MLKRQMKKIEYVLSDKFYSILRTEHFLIWSKNKSLEQIKKPSDRFIYSVY